LCSLAAAGAWAAPALAITSNQQTLPGGAGNAAAAGFQPGMYTSPPLPRPPTTTIAPVMFTAGTTRITDLTIGVINAPCHGPITRLRKSGFLGGGGPFSARIGSRGHFKIRVNEGHGGETGTITGRLHGTSATGTVSLNVRFFGLTGVPNPRGSSNCGVTNLTWSASKE
jgi:hypothetical protein